MVREETMHVLYTDDSKLDAILLERCFTMQSSAIMFTHFLKGASLLEFLDKTFSSATQAINNYAINNYVLLLDINMPGLNGFDVLKSLKNHTNNNLRQLPVIMFSSSSNPKDKELSEKLGAEDYIVKPYLYEELLKICSKIIEKWNKV